MNKNIFISLFLVLLLSISVSAVFAEDTSISDTSNIILDEDMQIDVSDSSTIQEDLENNLLEDSNVNGDSDINYLDDSKNKNSLGDGETEGNIIVPDSEDYAGLNIAVTRANSGDIIQLKENAIYDVGSNNFTILKSNIKILGTNSTINFDGAGQLGVGAVFICVGKQFTFEGIIFNNTNGHKEYGQEISGHAINLGSTEKTVVNNCTFINCRAGVDADGATNCNITNCYFNGSAEKVTNRGSKEYGTKAINIKASASYLLIENNTFEGQILDGVSIASNSNNIRIVNNSFTDSCYAIYFGGAATVGTIIANNTFTSCGYCKNASGDLIFTNLPIICAEKASDGFKVCDNKFIVNNGSVLIRMESGNTKHGYPSLIGDINITNNEVLLAEGAESYNVTFVSIFSNEGELSPYAPISIINNILPAGIKAVKVWLNDWGTEDSTTIRAADQVSTFINLKRVNTAEGKATLLLGDLNGDPIPNALISYMTSSGEIFNATTNEEGLATIIISEDGLIDFVYEGNASYKPSYASLNFTSTYNEKIATSIKYEDMKTTALSDADSGVGKYFLVSLKDADGNLLEGKTVLFGFNGKIYEKETDEDGVARLQINLKRASIYTFAVSFLGDDDYLSSFAVAKITVNKQTASLTVPAKTYKASAKTKTLTATFKSAFGNPLSNKKITFTVNGKTYTTTTNSKGVASVNISLNKKGTYSFTVKYAGDNSVAAITKTAKLVLN